jgi:DNA adenine methylase
MKITAVAPWKGSNRMLAEEVGKHLKGCAWVGITCAGGMSEIPYITARTILVNDVHRHVINLAWSIREYPKELQEKLATATFHPDELRTAQRRCLEIEEAGYKTITMPNLQWAVEYFLASWMSRNGTAGCKNEFQTKLSLRYTPHGGDSAVRLRSAIESIDAWTKTMQRCTFTTECMFDMLRKCHDEAGNGIYIDATFPDAGDDYKFKLSMQQHELLPQALARFDKTKVVMRWYDHQLIRRLYPERQWTWHYLKGRDSANNAEKPEVILVNRGAA